MTTKSLSKEMLSLHDNLCDCDPRFKEVCGAYLKLRAAAAQLKAVEDAPVLNAVEGADVDELIVWGDDDYTRFDKKKIKLIEVRE